MILLPRRAANISLPFLTSIARLGPLWLVPRRTFSTSSARLAGRDLFEEARLELNFYKKRAEMGEKYAGWSSGQLLARIQELESAVGERQVGSSSSSSSAIPNGHASEPRQSRTAGEPSTLNASAGPAVAARYLSQDPPRRLGKTGGVSAKRQEGRTFDVSNLPVRKIALRFAYDGANYSGLAQQGDGIPDSASSAKATNTMPTVEALLWNALCMARLVDPAKGMAGAGWSRCGRTDRGVSAAGQVVALWVRSRKVDEREMRRKEEERLEVTEAAGGMKYTRVGTAEAEEEDEAALADLAEEERLEDGDTQASSSNLIPGVSSSSPELPYIQSLNKLLPETIRVLGWSPVRPSFNARFDCRYRHYKYFFTSGPPDHLLPPQGQSARRIAPPKMDIDAMREAASYFLGEHDFRNFCKVDASKQIKNFRRRIDGVSIDEVESGWPSAGSIGVLQSQKTGEGGEAMYVLNLRGTAFLYHQVRHIMVVLLLVGAGLEKPSIVKELLNIHNGAWQADKAWLRAAGVRSSRSRAVELPGSTATEPDGATANTSSPRLKALRLATETTSPGEELFSESDEDADLLVYDRKPGYEMAADRPLVLWECGFRPRDIAWRTGPYDGPLPGSGSGSGGSLGGSTSDRVSMSSEQVTGETEFAMGISNDLYRIWNQHAISAELTRHFFLAAASPAAASTGTKSEGRKGPVGVPAGTFYQDARWPVPGGAPRTLPSTSPSPPQSTIPPQSAIPPQAQAPAHARAAPSLPFGNGVHRPVVQWKGLANRQREDTPEEKNERWVNGKGKRKAEAKAVAKAEAKAILEAGKEMGMGDGDEC
ncbi:pseudouridine synthase [Microstroma glucosiphilum]|uniref:Pseudouridine synthase n=1 Tax=Pseudomicrostroma glucosiphilum TaxID=1684307 RepID=A0A316U225_9BASI|nr:pseudouridine synthase [Pseudomicrostroma glucosiphilum]PWN19409.1 pseudouridine synthase [Pseudomicrostroma glucosiphilum]